MPKIDFKTHDLDISELDGIKVGNMSFASQLSSIYESSKLKKYSYVCVANVHMMIEAIKNKEVYKALLSSSFIVPDGMPLVWLLKRNKNKNCERVAGYDLVIELCKKSEQNNSSVMFFGSTYEILDEIEKNITDIFPNLSICKSISPPFGDLDDISDSEIINNINNENPQIIFVSLGCPKQELWMYKNHLYIDSLLIGVGGVFPIIAGKQKRAPKFIRSIGLEWLHRLLSEPGRLWKRYLYTNTYFIFLVIKSFLCKLLER